MTEFKLDENDFRLISVVTTDTHTLTPIRATTGILRNLDATNRIVFATESAGDDAVNGIVSNLLESNHKCILNAGDDIIIRNFRKLFVKANGGNCLLQWIPLSF